MPINSLTTSRSSLPHWAIVVLFLLACLPRLAFAMLPLNQHLLLLEDDAWMVTAIARNWALGLGITADGVYPTNGFHPLYTLTLGAIPYLVTPQNVDAGFTASLIITALLATLVIWPLYLLTRRLAGDVAALIAVMLYAINLLMVRLTVNAMETAMALLLFTTFLYAIYAFDLARIRSNLLLAGLTAAAILTRLDTVLLFAAIVGARFLWGWQARRLRRETVLLSIYVVVTLALLGPYFAYNRLVFGSFSPSSGTALAYLHSYEGSFAITNGLQSLFYNSAIAAEWIPSTSIMIVCVIIAAAVISITLRARLGRALPLVLYLPLPGLYYGYLQQQSNPRYFVGLSVVIMILLAWMLALWYERGWRGAVATAIVGIIVLNAAVSVQWWQRQRAIPQLTQPTSYEAAIWMRDNLAPAAVIGAKNSGIYQYYSGHTVINIDGKLNHEILPAMEERRLFAYLQERGITHLVDREETLADHIQFYSAEFGDAPRHHIPSMGERFRIYRSLLLSSLRLGPRPQIDRRDDFVPTRSFLDVARPIQAFARPNEAANPVVVFEIVGDTP